MLLNEAGNGRLILSGIAAADVIAATGVGMMVLSGEQIFLPMARVRRCSWLLVAAIVFAIPPGVLSGFPFVLADYVVATLRLSFVVGIYVLVRSKLSALSRSSLLALVETASVALSASTLLVWFAALILDLQYGLETRVGRGGLASRAAGLYAEPAFAALSLGLLLVLLVKLDSHRIWVVSLNLVALLATQSPIGLALIGVSVATWSIGRQTAPMTGRCSRARMRLLLPVAGLAVVMVAVGTGRGPAGQSVDRLAGVVDGTRDSSAQARLVDSWTVPLAVVREQPLFGVGIGQLAPAARDVGETQRVNVQIWEGRSEGWNLLAWVLGSGGFVALAGVVWFSWFESEQSVDRIALIVYAFGSGGFLTPGVWIWLAVLGAASEVLLSAGASTATSPNSRSW